MNRFPGIRWKLLTPLFFLAGTFTLSLQLYWLPAFLEKEKSHRLAEQAKELKLLSETIAGPLHSSDMAQIYNTLDRVLRIQNLWVSLNLHDNNGSRIYPFTEDKKNLGVNTVTLTQEVLIFDKTNAVLSLEVSLTPVQLEIEKEAQNLQVLIIFILSVSILVGIPIQERLIRRPISALVDAATALSKGEFNTQLPPASRDDIGVLVNSFNDMREKIFTYQKDLKSAIEKADAASQAKSQFLANMSHEIRTPLAAIIGYAETILDSEGVQDEQYNSTKTILENGKHLLQIINDILDLSKIEARKLDIDKVEIPLFDILRHIETIVGLQAREKSLEFSIQYEFPLPICIYSDEIRLRQILVNLCSNAIKFTENGFVHIHVVYEQTEQTLKFEVTDSGIGLEQHQLVKIFQPFSQADFSIRRKYGGTGLGLSLSKQLASLLGGHISAYSRKDEGSTFTLVLSVGHIDRDQLAHCLEDITRFRQIQEPPAVHCKLKGKILMADDTAALQKLIAMYLKKADVDIEFAANGAQAVDMALTGDYDVVLMDLQMPVMDGLTATRELRKRRYEGKIVALTANAFKEDREQCMASGCDDYLTKPVQREHFLNVLARYIGTANEVSDRFRQPIKSELEDEEGFEDLLLRYAESLQRNLKQIDAAREGGDWDSVRRIIHEIKGTGGAFGYPELSGTAGQLELMLIHKKVAEAESKLGELVEMCGAIIDGTKHMKEVSLNSV